MPANQDAHSLVSLKEYTDTRFAAMEHSYNVQLTAMERAIALAAAQMDKRLDGMNKFRDVLRDQSSRMATKAELDAAMAGVEKELRQLREFKVSLEAKASQQSVNLALGLSILSMIIGIVLKLL